MANKDILKPFIRSWEGGFSCVYGDKGGATKWGVTIGTYRSFFGQGKSVNDLKNMTEYQWDYIYKRLFWDKCKADDIQSQPIANLIVDWYWNSGSYGIKIPQKVLNVKTDGVIGAKTISAINNYTNKKELFTKLWKEREAFFRRIGVGTQAKFLKGWLNRLNGIQFDKLLCNGGKIIML